MARIALVFLVALTVKLAYVHERVKWPDIDHPTLDSLFHDQWARGLAFNEWTPDQEQMRHEPYFRAPLYPYFVSAVYRFAGTRPVVLFSIQAVLGAATVALMFWFCCLVFDRRTAWVAAALQIGYWPFTYHEAERLIPALSLLLDMLFLFFLIRAGRDGTRRNSIVAGICAGLSAIARPTILIVMPFAALWLWKRTPVARGRSVLFLTVATLLVIAPVTVRNIVVGHDHVFIASQGGVNFFIGNNAQSNGVKAVVPGTRADWWGGYEDTHRIAEQAAGQSLKASEVSKFWFRKGVDFLLTKPKAAMQLYVRKAALLLGNGEPSNERQLYFRRRESMVLSFLIINFAFLLATSAVGISTILRKQNDKHESTMERSLPFAFMAPYALGILAFFVTSRFRLPVAMFLVPLSAAGLVAVFELFREKNWRVLQLKAVLAVAIFSLSAWNPYGTGAVADARGQYSLGVDYYRTGDYGRARDTLTRALEADSSYAPAWTMRGRSHAHLGDLRAAISDLETACRLDQSSGEPDFQLGVVYQKAGRHDDAERAYLRAIDRDSTRVESFNNLADIYFQRGRVDDAAVYLIRALDVDSTFVNANYGMGYYYEKKGDYTRAAAMYRRALPFQPASARLSALIGLGLASTPPE